MKPSTSASAKLQRSIATCTVGRLWAGVAESGFTHGKKLPSARPQQYRGAAQVTCLTGPAGSNHGQAVKPMGGRAFDSHGEARGDSSPPLNFVSLRSAHVS